MEINIQSLHSVTKGNTFIDYKKYESEEKRKDMIVEVASKYYKDKPVIIIDEYLDTD